MADDDSGGLASVEESAAEYMHQVRPGDIPAHVTEQERWWWALQMLVVIPLPALLMSQLQLLLLESLSGTLVDGSSPIIGEYLHVLSLMSHLIRLHSIWSGYALFDPDVHQHYALCSLSTS